MKHLLMWLFLSMMINQAVSQTTVTQSFPVKAGQNISLHFDYPQKIEISTWDKNEIQVDATVNINNGEQNDAFSLLEEVSDRTVSISNKIDMERIPTVFYIVENGKKTRLNSKEELENHKKKFSDKVSYNQTKDIEVTLKIKVPASAATDLVSVYGMIEMTDFNGSIKAEAKFGGIDASLTESKIGKIKLTNRFGKIYSDLKLTPVEKKDENFFISITAEPGRGPSYDIVASYGNIYIRKPGK